jgi:hypothetical protein
MSIVNWPDDALVMFIVAYRFFGIRSDIQSHGVSVSVQFGTELHGVGDDG